jgi:hypothetical protein
MSQYDGPHTIATVSVAFVVVSLTSAALMLRRTGALKRDASLGDDDAAEAGTLPPSKRVMHTKRQQVLMNALQFAAKVDVKDATKLAGDAGTTLFAHAALVQLCCCCYATDLSAKSKSVKWRRLSLDGNIGKMLIGAHPKASMGDTADTLPRAAKHPHRPLEPVWNVAVSRAGTNHQGTGPKIAR